MPDRGLTRRDLYSAILFGVAVYLALRFISQIADVLLIFSMTLLVVVNLTPAVSWLEKKKVPRQASAAGLAVITLGLIGLTLYLIIPPAIAQLQDLITQAPAFLGKAESWAARVTSRNPALGSLLPKSLSLDFSTVSQFGRPLLGGVTQFTQSLFGAVAGAFLVFISTIYSLANPGPIKSGFIRALDQEHRQRAIAAGEQLSIQLRAWGRGVLLSMLAIFLLTWIALLIIGIKQAFLFAVIAGLLEAAPIIGPVLSAIPPSIVTLLQDPTLTIWVIVAFIIIQQFENHILVPMLMSHELSLHPVTVIFSVLVMGGLFGIIGIFLATPAAAAVGIIYEELYLCGHEQRCADQQPADKPDSAEPT